MATNKKMKWALDLEARLRQIEQWLGSDPDPREPAGEAVASPSWHPASAIEWPNDTGSLTLEWWHWEVYTYRTWKTACQEGRLVTLEVEDEGK